MNVSRWKAHIALLAVVALAPLSRPQADPCGMVPPPLQITASRAIERVGVQKTYVAFDRGVETMVLRPGFQGKVDEFGMLIPFPSPPTVRKVDDNIFSHIAAAIDPPEVVARVQRFPVRSRRMGASVKSSAAPKMDSAEKELAIDDVRVVKQEAVGMYEVAVLAAGGAKALKGWMDDNGFRYPDGMDAVVEEYVQSRWYFVAIKTRVGNKGGVNPSPGMRSVDPRKPAGAQFSGFVQAMGFRFKTKDLVVPMRLSVFNTDGNARNIVYVLARKGTKIEGLPESFVKRQVSGRELYRNVVDPLPLRVIGGTKSDLNLSQLAQLDARRDPAPHNGLAKELFGTDVLAMTTGKLASAIEEEEKALLNIGESLGLRGREIDDLLRSETEKKKKVLADRSLQRLQGMTMTVIDGLFDREILAKQNLRFRPYKLAQNKNNKQNYDAIQQGPVPNMGGMLYRWRVSSVETDKERDTTNATGAVFSTDSNNSGGGKGLLGWLALVGVALMAGIALQSGRKRHLAWATSAVLLLGLGLAEAKQDSLSTTLAGDDGAAVAEKLANEPGQLGALARVVAESDKALVQGRAIVALAESAHHKEAAEQLTSLASKAELSALVQTWIAAGRIQQAQSVSELKAIQSETQRFPAARRPWLLRMEVLVGSGSQTLDVIAEVPELQAKLPEMLAAKKSAELLDIMLTAQQMILRQHAASQLSTRKGIEGLLKTRLAYRKGKAIPWEGGPLFLPGIEYTKAGARDLADSLIRWMQVAEQKNDSPNVRIANNNLRSPALAGAAGYTPPSDGSGSAALWLGVWTQTFGAGAANAVLLPKP